MRINDFNQDYYKTLKAIVLTGGLILKKFQGKIENIPKKSDLPQEMVEETSTAHTILDDLVQEVTLEILESHFPKIGINVEESTDRINRFSKDKKGFCFHLDPLDGTFAYIKGREDYSIGAAFSIDLKFIASAIYFPEFDRMYYAEKKKGMLIQSSQGVIYSFKRPQSPLKTYCQKRCENLLPIVEKMNLVPLDCLSAHHKVIAVAEGKSSVQMSHLAKPHDFGIPQVILEEAGGVSSDLNGDSIEYDDEFSRLPYFFAFFDESVKNEFFHLLKEIK